MPGLLYADDLVLCDELEENLRAMVGQFAEVCRRRGLKVNVGKSKVMVLNGKEGLKCEVYADEIHLKHVLEFKYLLCVLNELGAYATECSRKVVSGRRASCAIFSARNLQLHCASLA